jgi:hypothetical protein
VRRHAFGDPRGHTRLSNTERLETLEITPDSAESVRAIISAWFEPFVARLDTDKGSNFVRLLAREASDPGNAERGIVETYLDPSARRCMARLAEALPGATEGDISCGYQFCIAAMISSVTGAGRMSALSDGATRNTSEAPPLDGMLAFATAGIMALSGPPSLK